jgi:hypothetical protein
VSPASRTIVASTVPAYASQDSEANSSFSSIARTTACGRRATTGVDLAPDRGSRRSGRRIRDPGKRANSGEFRSTTSFGTVRMEIADLLHVGTD